MGTQASTVQERGKSHYHCALTGDGGQPAHVSLRGDALGAPGDPEHAGSALTAFTASLSLVLTVGLLSPCHKWADRGLRVTKLVDRERG